MRRLGCDVRLALLAQSRARFLHIYALVTLLVVVGFRLGASESLTALALPVFLFVEPGLLGVNMAAAYRYLQKTEGSSSALLVTPLRPAEHVLALSLAASLVGTAFGAAAFAAIVGPDLRTLALVPPLFLQGLLSGLLGFALSLRYEDFTRFILGSILWVALYQAPLFFHFGAAPAAAVGWVPTMPALLAYRDLMQPGADPARLGLWCGWLALFVVLGTLGTTRFYQRGIRLRAELA